MQTNSDYADTRIGAISAAEDIFGECSFEVWQVMEAWEAVGVGTSSGICVEISGDSPVCDNEVAQLAATGVSGATYTWNYIPGSWSTYTSGSDGEYLNILDFGTSIPGQCFNIGVITTISGESDSDLFSLCLEDCGGGVFRSSSSESDILKIYPNPTNGLININSNSDSAIIQIFNNNGKLLNTINNGKKEHVIMMHESPGIYFIRIIDENSGSIIGVKKVIKL